MSEGQRKIRLRASRAPCKRTLTCGATGRETESTSTRATTCALVLECRDPTVTSGTRHSAPPPSAGGSAPRAPRRRTGSTPTATCISCSRRRSQRCGREACGAGCGRRGCLGTTRTSPRASQATASRHTWTTSRPGPSASQSTVPGGAGSCRACSSSRPRGFWARSRLATAWPGTDRAAKIPNYLPCTPQAPHPQASWRPRAPNLEGPRPNVAVLEHSLASHGPPA